MYEEGIILIDHGIYIDGGGGEMSALLHSLSYQTLP